MEKFKDFSKTYQVNLKNKKNINKEIIKIINKLKIISKKKKPKN
jgi:hypothetical protein